MTGDVQNGHHEQMGSTRRPALIRQIADSVERRDGGEQHLVAERLAALTGAEWLRLDESARRPYWGMSPLDGIADWARFLGPGAASLEVIAASMCRDGRMRQAAVTRLVTVPEPVAAAALAVRVADWVPEVGSAASAALEVRHELHDAKAVLPVLLALRQRLRGREPAAGYLARLADGGADSLRGLAVARDRSCRMWALEMLAERGGLTPSDLAERALRDHDQMIALWCAQRLAVPSGKLPDEAGLRLLSSAWRGVRAFTIGHVNESLLTRPMLEKLMLDRSGAVRSMARWRWKRLWGDPAPIYRAVLESDGRPYRVAAALTGLAEDRDPSLPAAAVPFLAHPSPAVRCAAVQAISCQGTGGDVPAVLVPMLGDGSAKVAGAALRHLRGHAIPLEVLAVLDMSDSAPTRRIALSVRQQQGIWNRVQADLAALNDHDLAGTALSDLLSWLQYGAATSYDRPSHDQAEAIAALLQTDRLTIRQRREIAFAAGIR